MLPWHLQETLMVLPLYSHVCNSTIAPGASMGRPRSSMGRSWSSMGRSWCFHGSFPATCSLALPCMVKPMRLHSVSMAPPRDVSGACIVLPWCMRFHHCFQSPWDFQRASIALSWYAHGASLKLPCCAFAFTASIVVCALPLRPWCFHGACASITSMMLTWKGS